MIGEIKTLKKSEQPFRISSKKIINDFIRGESDAFSQIYRKYRGPILKKISLRIKDLQIAEELAQEVFMRIYRFRDQYNSEYEFSSWIWAVAKNVTLDYLVRAQVDPLISRPHQQLGLELQYIACEKGSAEAIFMEKTKRRHLFQMMKKLPKLQRKAILLRVVKGRSYYEIARSLKVSLSAVKSLIHRGKVSLQNVMLHRYDPI